MPKARVRQQGEDLASSGNGKLQRAVEGMSAFFQRALPPVPELPTLSAQKKFCGDLLEGRSHPWESIRPQKSDKDFSVAFSLFLARKVLPAEPPSVRSWLNRMEQPRPCHDPYFEDFLTEEVPKYFSKGWDKGYRRRVAAMSLPTSSCTGAPRSEGGLRGREMDTIEGHETLIRLMSIAHGIEQGRPSPANVACVPDGGKWRIVTINGPDHNALRPLHQALYDHLSESDWLLRGNAKPSSFPFTGKGGVVVSGDYEAATDSIPLHLYQKMLHLVSQTSTEVPSSVWTLAMQESQKDLCWEDKDGAEGPAGAKYQVRQRRGQLMGSLLSFPFLCLLNHLIFRWNTRRYGSLPVVINGDDIVFQGPEQAFEEWSAGVNRCGLVLSRGKTLVSSRFFTLNSTPFKVCDTGRRPVKRMPFFRSAPYLSTKREGDTACPGLRGRMLSFIVGGSRAGREAARTLFVRENYGTLLATRRSVAQLQLPLTELDIRLLGLRRREIFYRSVPRGESDFKAEKSAVGFGFVKKPHWEVSRRGREKAARDFLSATNFAAQTSEWVKRPVDVLAGSYRFVSLKTQRHQRLWRGAGGSTVWPKGYDLFLREREDYCRARTVYVRVNECVEAREGLIS